MKADFGGVFLSLIADVRHAKFERGEEVPLAVRVSYDKDKKFRRDDIIDNEDMWNSFLKKMDEDFVRETAYGSGDAPVVNLAEEAL